MSIRHFLRYGILGGISTGIHISVAYLYVFYIGSSLYLSNISGFLCAFSFSFLSQAKFVFQSKVSFYKGLKYFIVQVSSLLAAIFLSALIGPANIYFKIILVAIFLPIMTFLVHKFWTFSGAKV